MTYYTSASKRYQAAGNLRWKELDVIASYVWGDDEDGKLSTAARDKFEFKGYSLQAALADGQRMVLGRDVRQS